MIATEEELLEYLRERHTFDLLRVETQPAYDVGSDGDDFRRYLRGEPLPAAAAKSPWLDMLAADTAAGRIWRKVHLTGAVPTTYERYEMEWGFIPTVGAGEQVRIFDRITGCESEMGDWFVLDLHHVVLSHYDLSGRWLGAEPVTGPTAVAYQKLAEAYWDMGVGFGAWWAAHPQYHRDQVAAA